MRHVLVTGSSSGIGRAISEQLLKSGHIVIGIARSHQKFCPSNENYKPIKVDLSDLGNLHNTLSKILLLYPSVDGLVSNAGFGKFGSIETFSINQISNFINVNLVAHIAITKFFLPHFKTQKKGDIIFIGSESSHVGARNGSLYAASKFGLRGFCQAIRDESSGKNIRVSLVNPGMVRTAFFDDLKFKPGKNLENAINPEDVANMVMSIFNSSPNIVIDEINLSPLKKVISFE